MQQQYKHNNSYTEQQKRKKALKMRNGKRLNKILMI